MKKIYEDYTRYNVWANSRMLEVFAGLTEAQLEQHIMNSFPSVKLTFMHIWDAEWLWLQRLNGVSPKAFPSKNFTGSWQEFKAQFIQTSTDFSVFTAAQPAEFFDKILSVSTITAGDFAQRAGDMVHHCMNHSTYHRGQLTMMARQLGLENLPSTDLIKYLREQ